MITPDRWPAIAAAAIRDRVPAPLFEDAVGAGLLRLAELHAAGETFDKPSHAGTIARNAAVDFVREMLGRNSQKFADPLGHHVPADSVDVDQLLDDRARLANVRRWILKNTAHNWTPEIRDRRLRVLDLLAEGYTANETGQILGVSESRVSQMLRDIRNGACIL